MLDSDNIQTGSERRRADILAAVSFTSNSLLQSGNWRDSLDASLRALGMASGANRAYFFENTTTDNGVVVTSQTAEWAAPGIEPQINNQDLQQVPFVEAGLARWLDQLEKGRPIYGSVAEFPESEQPLLLAQDIRSIVVMPVHTAGRLAGFLGFDDCEQQRAWTEPEFNALNAASSALGAAIERQFLEQQLRFAQKMEAIGCLASGVAHEFNNMLQTIVGRTDLVSVKLESNQKVTSELKEILATSDRAKTLTREMLLFARKQSLQQSTVNLGPVCESVSTMVQPVLGPSVQWSLHVASPAPIVLADAGLITQALMNLCLNGRDAIEESGTLSLSCESVELNENSAPTAGRYACLSVTDTGRGMSPAVRERIFEPFFTTKATGAGTGIGLSVVYGVISEYGGFIEVQSEPDQGSVVKIFLPVTDRSELNTEEHKATSNISGKTLLLIDDEAIVLDALCQMFEYNGYQVMKASSAQEACDILEIHAKEIDAVITDWSRPNMHGDEVIAIAKKYNPNIKSILLSGYSSDDIPIKSKPDSLLVLHKPVDFRDLQLALSQLFSTSNPD